MFLKMIDTNVKYTDLRFCGVAVCWTNFHSSYTKIWRRKCSANTKNYWYAIEYFEQVFLRGLRFFCLFSLSNFGLFFVLFGEVLLGSLDSGEQEFYQLFSVYKIVEDWLMLINLCTPEASVQCFADDNGRSYGFSKVHGG